MVSGGNIRFADFAEKYMTEYAEVCLKPTTVTNYQQALKRVNLAIGHIKLKDLTVLHIQAFYRQLQEEGVRGHVTAVAKPALIRWWVKCGEKHTVLSKQAGISLWTLNAAIGRATITGTTAEKIAALIGEPVEQLFTLTEDRTPLAVSSIRSYHRTLSAILKKAVRWGYLAVDPAEKAELPLAGRHKARYLDEPDARRLLRLLQKEPIKWRTPIMFDLLSGLRRGELLGLRWQDVDLDTGVVHIVQTWNYTPGKGNSQMKKDVRRIQTHYQGGCKSSSSVQVSQILTSIHYAIHIPAL